MDIKDEHSWNEWLRSEERQRDAPARAGKGSKRNGNKDRGKGTR